MHDDPIAFFLTFVTYGTWLPGDGRGWVEYRRGFQLPDPVLYADAKQKMTEDACFFTASERQIVENQVMETCTYRKWTLHSVNCRSNHLHLVVGAANTHPTKIRDDVKAWCTRRLKELSNQQRVHWWAERGSHRFVYDELSLVNVIQYVNEAQDRKHLDES